MGGKKKCAEFLEKAEAEFPDDAELNEDAEFNRAVAANYARSLEDGGASMRAAAVDLSKWTLTSLQAINAGGAVAVSQLDLGAPHVAIAGAAFVVGLLLPLIAAHMAVLASLDHALTNGRFVGYWQAVALNGFRIRNMELEMVRFPAEVMNRAKWPIGLGWASTGLFIIGAAAVGLGL